MIGPIQHALKAMLHRDANLPPSEVDVRFATPSREFTASLNRPTVNFYLYELVENVRLRAHDMDVARSDHTGTRRLRPRRMDLKYAVNVFFKSQPSEPDEQEWLILWRVLATLMRNAEWPEQDLPGEVQALGVGVIGAVCQPEQPPRAADLWTPLGNTPRTGLHYVLTVPLDLNVESLAPLVLAHQVSFKDNGHHAGQRDRHGWRLVTREGRQVSGAEVRLASGEGLTTTDLAGVFFLRVDPSEARQLQVRLPGETAWHELTTTPGEYRAVLN